MSDFQSLSNSRQLNMMLFLGGFLVPLLGIVPACMGFFHSFPADAPAGNTFFRIVMVVVSCGLGWLTVWYVKKTYPKEIRLGESLQLHYLNRTVTKAYSDIEVANLAEQNGKVDGARISETIFTLKFTDKTTVKVSVDPEENAPFFEELRRRLGTASQADEELSSLILDRTSYVAAYSILPHCVFQDFDSFIKTCQQHPEMVGKFLGTMAGETMGFRPPETYLDQYRCYLGNFDDREYLAIEYPTKQPGDEEDTDTVRQVLAPYFSVILFGSAAPPQLFNLGQAPFGNDTTVRGITGDGTNANLGPGPTPNLELFLDAIRKRLTSRQA